ncbi:MAG: hypothetical protein HYR91_09815 [Flavobacteriia bacterium]|nr:hypothetical protein [Flavobacteriia bacterium]
MKKLNQFVFFSFTFLLIVGFQSCTCQIASKEIKVNDTSIIVEKDPISEFQNKHTCSSLDSKSIGTVSNGKLENGCYLPYSGVNFKYFAENSYLMARCFVNCSLNVILLEAFKSLELEVPNRIFYLMEGSNEHGGKIAPHRTHQNGTSIDLMIPLIKNNEIYTGLDTLGVGHYLLSFTNKGEYSEDPNIQIDFETLALEILAIHEMALKNRWKISKIILKTELQPYLYQTKYGDKLRKSAIYFTQKLEPVINELHDDHIHIDFEEMN